MSLTKPQTSLYWRSWASVVHAQGWRGDDAVLRGMRLGCFVSPDLDRVYQSIWRIAIKLADVSAHGKLSPDALRHACSVVALGRQVSSKVLSNDQLDRVLSLFRLLADPENLANVEAWQNPELGERRRQVHAIQQIAPAYWRHVAFSKFGTADLDRLSIGQLRQLSLTIRLRRVSQRKRMAEASVPMAEAEYEAERQRSSAIQGQVEFCPA